MKNDDEKSNDVDKLKASNKRREDRRKGIGLLIPNEGVSPTQCIPSSMHEEICAFFSSINYDCGKGTLCKYAHHGKKSDFPNDDFEKLLDHVKEKNCAKLSSKWLQKSKDYNSLTSTRTSLTVRYKISSIFWSSYPFENFVCIDMYHNTSSDKLSLCLLSVSTTRPHQSK